MGVGGHGGSGRNLLRELEMFAVPLRVFSAFPRKRQVGPDDSADPSDFMASDTSVRQIEKLSLLNEGSLFQHTCVTRTTTRLN